MRYLVLGIIVYAISLLLKLNVYFAVATLLLGCITLPFHIRLYNRAKREKRRFYEFVNSDSKKHPQLLFLYKKGP